MKNIRVIIPAFNERNAVGAVLKEIPWQMVTEVIVVDNGSTDDTAVQARRAGATVLTEHKKGYGNACLKGLDYISKHEQSTDIVVFLDADHSDYPEEMIKLTEPIVNGNADLVIGSRALGNKEKGAMTPQQIYGNWLATNLIRIIFKVSFTDLGPFRAISWDALKQIGMKDRTYGWTVEMQVKAAKAGLKCMEVPVNYRRRIGKSKVSGTVKGTFLAGYKILYTIFKYM